MADKSSLAVALAERDAAVADLEERLAYVEDALAASHQDNDALQARCVAMLRF